MARCGGGRPTIENCITLDIRYFMSAGLVSGCSQSGTLQWMWTNNRLSCQAAYQASLGDDTGLLHLIRIICFDPFGRFIYLPNQTIRLVATTPPYGGCRCWLVCPQTGERVMKLHLPPDAQTFASRQAHCLGYTVQREGAGAQAAGERAKHGLGSAGALICWKSCPQNRNGCVGQHTGGI